MSSKGFTHLHLHSQYSLLDGAIAFDKLLKRCKELQMDAVAVTDHGNLFGAIEFYTKALAANKTCTRKKPRPDDGADQKQQPKPKYKDNLPSIFNGVWRQVLFDSGQVMLEG